VWWIKSGSRRAAAGAFEYQKTWVVSEGNDACGLVHYNPAPRTFRTANLARLTHWPTPLFIIGQCPESRAVPSAARECFRKMRNPVLKHCTRTALDNGGNSMATMEKETTSLIGSDKVEGTAVYGMDGNSIGTIQRIMIDKISGKVAYAVTSFGGFLGMGEDYYPLPWSQLKYDTGLGGYRTNLTVAQLKVLQSTAVQGNGTGPIGRMIARSTIITKRPCGTLINLAPEEAPQSGAS
jgi:hypothetical protein